MSNLPSIICLSGPTGSGKTAAAICIAAALKTLGVSVTVINADSRQVYRDFPIITAQPTQEEREVCPHCLYGWLESERKISAGQWADLAEKTIQETLTAGRLPVLVGGTGFYLRTLLDGIAEIPACDPQISCRIQEECHKEGSPALHERLKTVDPDYAARIHPNDSQRNMRALEVWESTGRTFTWWHDQTPKRNSYQVLRIGVGLPLQELTPFLEQRITSMMEQGAEREARRAMEICSDISAPAWSGIGCAELAAMLRGILDRQQCLERWIRNTRAYAKRQWTWFKADSRIQWFRPGEKKAIVQSVLHFLEMEA